MPRMNANELELDSMRMPLPSRLLFYFIGVLLPLGSHIADYDKSHIFNPLWPPHAKFHTGQTLMFSVFLGILTVYFASRKTTDKSLLLICTSSCAAIYWVTQSLAIVYPGTAFFDPEFDKAGNYPIGIPAQLLGDFVNFALIAVAVFIAKRKKARWV